MPFEDTLCYCSPAHGGWGIIRVAAQVPESYLLFVCPSACFRHGSLGAIQHGYKNQISFLYIEQSDIVNGYDKVIDEGIDELLEKLDAIEKHPRMLFVYVSCLDDFIGTDLEAVLAKAGRRHPEITFVPGHMNPIAASTKRPPMVTTLDVMQRPMPVWPELDDGVSLFGSFVPLPEDSDLRLFLLSAGFILRENGTCRNFDQYRELSRSRYCLLVKPYAALELESLKKRTGQQSLNTFITYDLDTVDRQYEMIRALPGLDAAGAPGDAVLAAARADAEASIREALSAIGDMPVFISDSATLLPFSMAAALLKYGFNVKRVYAQQVAGPDKAAFETVSSVKDPVTGAAAVEICQADHPNLYRQYEKNQERIADGGIRALSIGEEAGYLSGSDYVADLSEDGGTFGYSGIRHLMDMMKEAVREKADIRRIIEEYGGVI